ncbi:MAG: helix-turn-helix domain-containing protein [Agrobacterium cavarae]
MEGEGISEVCRDFGISRKTGYKIFNRYNDDGLEALTDKSRRPVRYANQLPIPSRQGSCASKKEKPHWGHHTIASRQCTRSAARRLQTRLTSIEVNGFSHLFATIKLVWVTEKRELVLRLPP